MNRNLTPSRTLTTTLVLVPKFTTTVCSLPSASVTAAEAGLPADTPAGSGPNPVDTLSPPSSTESLVAVTVNVRAVWLAPNVTVSGMPE